jgi:hypothetical protein
MNGLLLYAIGFISSDSFNVMKNPESSNKYFWEKIKKVHLS